MSDAMKKAEALIETWHVDAVAWVSAKDRKRLACAIATALTAERVAGLTEVITLIDEWPKIGYIADRDEFMIKALQRRIKELEGK